MNKLSDKLRNIIAQGWTGMLFLLFLMMLVDLNEFGMKGDFSALIKDPGIVGLWFVVIMASVNVLIQILIKTFDAKPFRWIIFGATVVYTLIFVGHQLDHLSSGVVFDFHFIIDIVHHTLGIWASIAAYRWARLPKESQT